MKRIIRWASALITIAALLPILPVSALHAADKAPNAASLAAMKAYKAVLQNEMAFYSTNNSKQYRLNEFDYWSGASDSQIKAVRFAVIDMDNDGIPELVLELTNGFDGAFEVLHYENGKVYGFNFVYRGMLNLSQDGTYLGSSGAYDACMLKAASITDSYKEEIVAWSASGQDAKGNLVLSHHIGKAKVTEAEYDALLKKMFDNPAQWHDFTDAGIALAFQ